MTAYPYTGLLDPRTGHFTLKTHTPRPDFSRRPPEMLASPFEFAVNEREDVLRGGRLEVVVGGVDHPPVTGA